MKDIKTKLKKLKDNYLKQKQLIKEKGKAHKEHKLIKLRIDTYLKLSKAKKGLSFDAFINKLL